MGACHYALLTASEGELCYEARPVPVSRWAREQGLTDPRLLEFEGYAAGRLFNRTRQQAEEQLAGRGLAPEEEQRLADYAAALNLAYFSGDLTGVQALDPEGALFRQWRESGTLFGAYFAMLEPELGRGYRHWPAP